MNYNVIENTLEKNKYDFNLFHDTYQLGKGSYGRVMSSIYKNDETSSFAIKYYSFFKDSDESYSSSQLSLDNAKNEIKFFESLSELPFIPVTFPKYYGYVHLVNSKQMEIRLYFQNEGDSIKNYFKKELPRWRLIKYFIDQLIMTFAFLQSHNYIHRDLKPDNILVRINKDSKIPKITLIDFGLGRQIIDNLTSRPNLTNMGGTMLYLSPERRKTFDQDDQKLNHYKGDCFSLGLVFLDLLLGKVFKNIEEFKDLKNVLKELKKSLLKKASSSSEEEIIWYYKNIFKMMLKRSCSNRLDFIDLYYLICMKTRRNIAKHLEIDLKEQNNILETSNSPISEKRSICKKIIEEKKLKMNEKSFSKKSLTENEDKYWKCRICGEKKKIKNFLILECLHKFCLLCLQLDWKTKINDKNNIYQNSITCCKCTKPISYDFLKKNADKALIAAYDEALVFQLCSKDSIISCCPKKECQSPYIADKSYSYVACQKCNFKFCLNCKADWNGHGGLTCQEFNETMKIGDVLNAQVDQPKVILKREKSKSIH